MTSRPDSCRSVFGHKFEPRYDERGQQFGFPEMRQSGNYAGMFTNITSTIQAEDSYARITGEVMADTFTFHPDPLYVGGYTMGNFCFNLRRKPPVWHRFWVRVILGWTWEDR